MVIKASLISKRRKLHGGGKEVFSSEDIISRFPDAILCHMLSFLPTKDAVRTSILSKRWSNVWISVPCIEIVEHSTDSLLAAGYTYESITRLNYCFMEFVDRVLQLNGVYRLRKFCLTCYDFNNYSRVRKWISAVITREIEELDLDLIKYHPTLPLPPSIFTSKNLVTLRLGHLGSISVNVPAMVHLPSLKILHLHAVVLSDDDHSFQNLIDGCPIIVNLDISVALSGKVNNTLFVRSFTLKSLRVHNVHVYYEGPQFRIIVDAANLEQLDLQDDVILQYDVIHPSSLVEVRVDFCGPLSRRVERDIYDNRLVELLRKLSNTKYLFLSCDMMKYLKYARWGGQPLFHNVTHLELKTIDHSWPVLPSLLECFPNLITFVFHKEGSRRGDLQFQAPKCSMLYLEEIKLTGFKGCAEEMKMVGYFLKNATVLKSLLIQSCYMGSKRQLEITKELLTLPRGPTGCPIIFK